MTNPDIPHPAMRGFPSALERWSHSRKLDACSPNALIVCLLSSWHALIREPTFQMQTQAEAPVWLPLRRGFFY